LCKLRQKIITFATGDIDIKLDLLLMPMTKKASVGYRAVQLILAEKSATKKVL
jgi:hypothetical protein